MISIKANSSSSCIVFPQQLEKFLGMLPRSCLRWFEIHGFPYFFSAEKLAADLAFWRARKVALVRQTAAKVTYHAAPTSSWMERALTTKSHPGPLSLLAELAADFYVVRQAQDPETFLWRGKHAGDPDPGKTFRRMETYCHHEESLPGVVSCRDIRWEDYDLVVCLDIPVPTRIVRQTRRTLWAYFSIEGGGPLVDISLKTPIDGYHLFLNHQFRRYRVRPLNRDHVLEFPFSFQSRQAWSTLQAHFGLRVSLRKGIIADRGSAREIPSPTAQDMQIMGINGHRLNLAGLVSLYASKKYALRLDPRRRWGNWLIEVIQSGCLFLGRSDSLDHSSPLVPGLEVHDYHEARRRIEILEADPNHFMACRALQSAITEYIVFQRPLADLTQRARAFLQR